MNKPTWKRLGKKYVSARSIVDIKKEWSKYLYTDDEGILDLSSVLPQLIDFSDLPNEVSNIIETPNILTNANLDRELLAKKAIASKTNTKFLLDNGNKSWSSVDAYHSAFLYGKAILAQMGLFQISVSGHNFIVDVFPNYGTHSYKRMFDEKYSELKFPIRILTINGQRVEHRHIWELLNRVFNICLLYTSDAADE